jgi:crotonobetainyl-CoA:carnitine CoA-transferase CaiB-like acyl-CoA transferase
MKLTEVLRDPHLHDRGMLHYIDHPDYGEMVVMGSPLRFAGIDPLPYDPSHGLGADNEAELSALGYSAEEIAALRHKGVL